jgi:large subunit ribosomal protein L24
MMKKEWSRQWVKSVQPRKQRKYRHNAPLHIRHKFMSANLAPELRRRFDKRSMPVRKGDEVEIMRGSQKGLRGTVNRIDVKKSKVYVEEIKSKKVDGSEIMKPLQPSNLKIIKLALDDKQRQMVVDRAEKHPLKKKKEPKKEVAKSAKEKKPEKEKAASKKKKEMKKNKKKRVKKSKPNENKKSKGK